MEKERADLRKELGAAKEAQAKADEELENVKALLTEAENSAAACDEKCSQQAAELEKCKQLSQTSATDHDNEKAKVPDLLLLQPCPNSVPFETLSLDTHSLGALS